MKVVRWTKSCRPGSQNNKLKDTDKPLASQTTFLHWFVIKNALVWCTVKIKTLIVALPFLKMAWNHYYRCLCAVVCCVNASFLCIWEEACKRSAAPQQTYCKNLHRNNSVWNWSDDSAVPQSALDSSSSSSSSTQLWDADCDEWCFISGVCVWSESNWLFHNAVIRPFL